MCRPVCDRTHQRSRSQGRACSRRNRSLHSARVPALSPHARTGGNDPETEIHDVAENSEVSPACDISSAPVPSAQELEEASLGTVIRRQDQQMDGSPSTTSKQRKMVRLFRKGSFVEIYSCSQQRWFLDGEVIDIAWQSGVMDGVSVSAGSTKIVYGHGMYFKWVESQRLTELVRQSSRPHPPEALAGHLTEAKQGRWWAWCYFRLQKGALQWWDTKEASSAEPAGKIHLQGLQLERKGLCIKLTSQTKEHHFQAQSAQWVDTFIAALRANVDFCEEDQLFRQGAGEM